VTTKVLIVEDEPAIQDLLSLNLRHAGFRPLMATDVASARAQLDQALPDLSGIEFARRLRADPRTRELPIIMLTARSTESDKLGGFDAGADDYITKPFSPRELIARIRALLRRSSQEASEDPVEVAGLRLEPETFRVIAQGDILRMGPTEFRLLHYLMRNLDRVLSRAKLLDGVWGDHVFIEERTVDVHIRRLRLALQPSGHDRLIETVRGGGYRFLPQ
jgi:two-component system phosphate regulon response regulator PhoB